MHRARLTEKRNPQFSPHRPSRWVCTCVNFTQVRESQSSGNREPFTYQSQPDGSRRSRWEHKAMRGDRLLGSPDKPLTARAIQTEQCRLGQSVPAPPSAVAAASARSAGDRVDHFSLAPGRVRRRPSEAPHRPGRPRLVFFPTFGPPKLCVLARYLLLCTLMIYSSL